MSLIEKSISNLIDSADKCKSIGADLIEIRLDCLEEQLSINILKRVSEIKKNTGLPVILTLRPTWEGGNFSKFEERRIDILENGIELGFDYIDLELKTNESKRDELISKAKDAGVKTIVSYHNFEKTPAWKKVFNRIKDCANTGGDIAKVAFFNKSLEDAMNILKAGSAAKNLDYNFTVMGLGPFGHVTRILAPSIGCAIVYSAMADGKEAVEGQINLNTLKEIWNLMVSQKD